MTIMKLNQLSPPQSGRIIKVHGMGPVRQRMMDMGLVPGAEIQVVRIAPLGDPVEYQVKGYHLSLRRREAQHILVDVEIMTLEQVQPPDEVQMIEVYGGHQLVQRLSDMALKAGNRIKVIENPIRGPLLIQVANANAHLGRGMARKILVVPVDGEKL